MTIRAKLQSEVIKSVYKTTIVDKYAKKKKMNNTSF